MSIEIQQDPLAPCELDTFLINGQKADPVDFGIVYSDTDGEGGCQYRHFVAYQTAIPEVLRKYGLNESEYFEVAGKLDEALQVSHCQLCL